MRTKDIDLVYEEMGPFLPITGFYPELWLEDDRNIALVNDDNDLALLEYERPGIWTGHYFFNSRGKKAVEAAKGFLREAFWGDYGVEVIRGLTPLHHLGARWLNRQIGMTSYGAVKTTIEPCELVIITKTEWEIMNG